MMNPATSDVHPIGSFFEAVGAEFLTSASDPPWHNGPSISYLQTARQAIAAIAAIYAAEGRDTLVAPNYLCESMIAGFDPARWKLETYKVNDSLRIDADDLLTSVSRPESTVVLSAAYFGDEPTAEHVAVVELLQERGARVVQDETHRVLGPLELLGDVAVASLRKLLPVADGAYVRGDIGVGDTIERPHPGWSAIDQKSDGDLEKATAAFEAADAILESHGAPPARASERTLKTLPRLDYGALRARRRLNAESLRDYLAEIKPVEVVSGAEVPSHMVIRVDNPRRVQADLARVDVFCPIHWPRPSRLSGYDWPDDLLSLPIDHRYAPSDMARVAEQLALAVAA